MAGCFDDPAWTWSDSLAWILEEVNDFTEERSVDKLQLVLVWLEGLIEARQP